jgi:hypothetical protein
VGVIGLLGRLSTLRQDKKHTPALCASLPISFRTSLHAQPCTRPLGAPLRYAGCHGFSLPLVAAVRPCIGSLAQHSCTPFASLRSDGFTHSCGLLRCTTIHSFATTLRYAYGSFSHAQPCPQGLLIVHVRHPAGPLRLRLRFLLPAVERHIIATCWVQVCPTGGRQATKNLALRNTDRCFPVRASQSQPQPAVGYGAWWRGSDRRLRLRYPTLRFFWVWGVSSLADTFMFLYPLFYWFSLAVFITCQNFGFLLPSTVVLFFWRLAQHSALLHALPFARTSFALVFACIVYRPVP